MMRVNTAEKAQSASGRARESRRAPIIADPWLAMRWREVHIRAGSSGGKTERYRADWKLAATLRAFQPRKRGV